jgi:glycosyltransferase involved in cell wall biosynthesis
MRILIAHNYYQQPGGEDVVFEAEASLLERRGHTVIRYVVRNDQVSAMSRARLAASAVWNRPSCNELHALVRGERIEVAHFHNTLPLISPAAYRAVRSAGAAVVQTLHNHRLICPKAILYRDGQGCTDCVGRSFAWPGIMHACYRNSRLATATVALVQLAHRAKGTYTNDVDLYIAPSQSTMSRLAGVLPANRIVVKPHFIDPDPTPGQGQGGYAVFVGRLSPEKGLETLLQAWRLLETPDVHPGLRSGGTSGAARQLASLQLRIIGDGPLAPLLASPPPGVQWLGRQPLDVAYRLIGDASALIFPSGCHETFGRSIAEAFAKGTPVIASNLGAAPEMIDPSRTGLLFEAGNAQDLARQIAALHGDPIRLRQMRCAARREYEDKYNAASNYNQLASIYERAVWLRHNESRADPHQPQLYHHELGRRQPA